MFFRLIGVALAALLASTACGLTNDEAPTLIAAADLPESLRPGQIPVVEAGPGSDQVHMIQEERLVTVSRRIAETPEELIETLLVGTFPEEAADGIQSAIFRTAQVTNLQYNEPFKVITIDLAPGSLNPDNSEQRFAFAQIVYTMTSLPEIDAVQFEQSDPDNPSAEPIRLAVQTDSGTSLPGARVTRESFASLDPVVPSASPAFDIPTAVPSDPNAESSFASVWMLDRNSKLVKVPRVLSRSPGARLTRLFSGPSADEFDSGVRTALPLDAVFIDIVTEQFEVDEGGLEPVPRNIAMVDLADGSLPTDDGSDERFLAVAQIVFTLTELPEIDLVVFSLDGVRQGMPRDGGDSLPFDPLVPNGLGRANYQSALGDFTPATGLPPTPTATPEP